MPRWVLLFVASCSLLSRASADESVFRDRVLPLFRQRCVSCHNAVDRKGDFSLQHRDDLLRSGYVEPGRPDDSTLLDAVTPRGTEKPSMPKNGSPLSAAERASLRAWIAAGATWPAGVTVEEAEVDDRSWWSLQPLVRPPLPKLAAEDQARVETPVDAFVLHTLRTQRLAPAPAAERRTLIRRLAFDLLGLPPAPAEIEAFVADDDPRAYERLVDRLLASPQYGERWARHWLDVVKYADTCGYDKDKLRPNAWPYRDYVIRAFNEDKPYDRFVQEQIAGDVLFPGTADGVLGLGFLAAGPWDFIGHVEVPEAKIDGQVARHTDRDEMVTNTLNTFCSVTIQCCQCHNHKFDPFTQEHYYGLQSVFAAVDRAERPYAADAAIESRRQQLLADRARLQAQQAELEQAVQREAGPDLARLDARIRALQPKATLRGKRPEFGYHSQIAPQPEPPTAKWVQLDLGRAVELRRVVLRPCHDEFAGIGAGFGFPVRFRVSAASAENGFADGRARGVADETSRDLPNPGLAPYEIALDGRPARFVRVTATRLAPRSNDFIFALAEVEAFDAAGNNVALGAAVTALDSIEAPVRWARKNLTDGHWAQAADGDSVRELAAVQQQRRVLLARVETPEREASRERLKSEAARIEQQLSQLPAGAVVYAAATHFAASGNFRPTEGQPRRVRVLHRGNVTQPRADAVPSVLPVFPGEPARLPLAATAGEGERRAALARWLVRPDHPLTWRSIVNRVWQHHFGRGLVDSPNDFGRMGRLPSHPELLDWLADEFRARPSFKHLHRLIVLSATYRQASSGPAEQDGENRFLARMSRRRLEAEEIRDALLAVSGRLDSKMGGPGYYLFVLERPEHSPHYEYHKFDPNDRASHRRSIYRFVVRSQPDPLMSTLDCADSSQSTPQRNETVTALQALSLLNNGFSLVMARHFASQLSAEPEDRRVATAFRQIAGRSPTPAELQRLTDYADRHGLANLCRLLFNLSEFVYVD